ncbi:MAG: YceI family protein [Candidatus Nanopelagicales bacterium]|jgi:polyisoprenoid-binding protein YceI|nr:YceI family protein [Candidatus Nanopelagicales bacterium]
MTDYTEYQGTWTIDPSHTRLGFVARHAMVTKVRGQFEEFAGTIVIDAANPSASTANVTVQLASVNTGSADRDAHLRSPDFFDVETNTEMTFVSTGVKQDGDEFVMLGDLTIKGVSRPVELELEPTGVATDPFGNVRAGFEGEAEISRKDFGLTWNVALEAGGVLVSDKIKIQLDVSAIKQA